MRHYEHLQWGTDHLRLAPWRGDPTIAELAPADAGRPPTAGSVARGLELVSRRGYRGVVTSALAPAEQHGYLDAGFTVHERLFLLQRSLDDLPTPPAEPRLRRGRRTDRARILALDATTFDSFWRLDELGLREAVTATPSARVRVTARPAVVGYAITGRAGSRGYLQRLAVHPDHQRAAIGSTLVLDGLRWLRRSGAKTALVNTQEANAGALALYRHLGFERLPDGLAVLSYRFESVR
ncbi:MAG: GNAT family N-acetyltransferase [Acidimicrobiales bacterium]